MQDYTQIACTIPSMCVGHRTRMAARALSRHYHAYFRGAELTASQFGILVSLAATPHQSIAELGQELAMDATTMVRAVQQLERRGLVTAEGGQGRTSKRSTLTPAGRRVLRRGVARWQAAHRAMVQALGGEASARSALAAVQRLERTAAALLSDQQPATKAARRRERTIRERVRLRSTHG